MMDYKEAIRRIEDHQRVHHMKEQPRCQKITEALSLAITALEQYGKFGGYEAKLTGIPIECFRPKPDETLLVRFNPAEDNIDLVCDAVESIGGAFPNNNVLALPKDMELHPIRATELLAIRAQINDLLGVR